jgi:hypothetical protein
VAFFFAFIALIGVASALDGWNYYRQVTITNNVTQALTDYQVNFTLDTAALIAQGKMRSDCGDLRVTLSDGQTLLPYWIEPNTCNTNSTKIWTKVPLIPASGSTTIYVWYGNPQATSQSNASATFYYYDDGSLYSSWTQGTYACTQDTADGNPAPSYKCPTGSGCYMYKNINLAPNMIVVFSVKTNALGNFYFLVNSTGAGQMYRIDTRSGCPSGFATTSSWTSWNYPFPGPILSANTWYKFTIVMNSTSASLYYLQGTDISPQTGTFGTLIGTYTITNNGGYIGLVGDSHGSCSTWWDNIIVRKYVSPEPRVSIGNEISTGNVYDESNGNMILSANFTIVRLNYDYSINSTQTVTNQPGLTSLTPGLYYITASANNYYERSLLVNFTGRERFSFYLPPSSSSVYVTFTVFDPSGTFYAQGSRLKLMTNTSTVIDVRLLDTSHRAVMPLILGKLYVIALENNQQSRVVGFVSATSTSITLYVNQLNLTVANYAPVIWNCTQNNTIQCAWQTVAGKTSGAKLIIYDANGNVVTTMTASTANGSFTYLQPNTTYRFVFQVFNDMQNVTYSFTNFNWTAPISPPTPNYFNATGIPSFDIKSVPSEYRLMFFGGLALIVALFFRRSHVPVGLALSLGIVVLCVTMDFLELDRNLILVLAIIVGLSFFELERERGAG